MYKCVKIIILCLLPLMAAGCWDSQEIEEMDITTVVIVDKAQEGYSYTVEVASYTTSESEQGGAPRSKVLKAEGKTFTDARDALERKSDRTIILSEVQSVIFTEAMAYGGIEGYMYRFRQNPDYRKTVYAAVTPDKPDDLMGAASESNTLVGMSINDTLESLVNSGQIHQVTMGYILTSLSCQYKGYLIPGIGLRDKEIALIGFYAMDGGVCKGFIPIEGNTAIVHIRKNTAPFSYTIDYEGKQVALKVDMKKEKPDVSYTGGQVRMGLHFDCEAHIMYPDGDMPVTEDVRQKIGRALESALAGDFKNTVKTSQDLQCDYLELHEVFRIRYPEIYRDLDWTQAYQNAEITVDMDIHMKEGNIDYRPKDKEV